ncbi:MAG: ROK family protein [Cryobacterium sp.]|nr:ROK family protein [Cryobacterium sp.]
MTGSLALAIDIGGTKVEAALVDESGRLASGSRFRRPTGASGTTESLAAAAQAVSSAALAALPEGATLLGVGVGSAGPIDQRNGRISPLNLPAWRDFPVVEFLSGSMPDTPITLRMDGLCITLAEHWVGAAQGCENVLGMVVSTGVGGGLILGGRTVTGSTGNAGHIGHVEVAGFDDACACGGSGCLEAIASGPRSVAWARERGWTGSSGEDLAASYAQGEAVATAAVERAGRAIGRAIGSATSLADLDLVVIGGGFSTVTPDLFTHIRAGVEEHSGFDFVRKVRVAPSALSDEGPLIGAAALVHRAGMLG